MERDVQVVLGPPGTGKTTTLIREGVETFLARGTPPDRIGYVAFTRKAAHEARNRVQAKFGLSEERLPFFSTLHALAYRDLQIGRAQVMQSDDWDEVAESLGLSFASKVNPLQERVTPDGEVGDRCLFVYAFARARLISIEEAWRQLVPHELPLFEAQRFAAQLARFKEARDQLDFTDMIDQSQLELNLDVLIIDEAQDLTPQQWRFARKLGRTTPVVFIAGDDDQAIYDWSGGDSTIFRNIIGHRRVLPLSHRLPRAVYGVADRLVRRIISREDKTWSPRDADGIVTQVSEIEDLDLRQGTWLLLARMRYGRRALERECRRQGVVYELDGEWSNQADYVKAVLGYEHMRRGEAVPATLAMHAVKFARAATRGRPVGTMTWSDVEWPFEGKPDWMDALVLRDDQLAYVRALRANGESLVRPGRVIISTIHGAKGGEAENVVLLTDVTKKTHRVTDDELRVWYVAVTRAIERLIIVRPRTLLHFNIET